MEIRDQIHGSILIEPTELSVIDSRYFQRLRHIKQLGFAEYSFPSATHNRYIHSLGTMETATQGIDVIFNAPTARMQPPSGSSENYLKLAQVIPEAYRRFRSVLRLAALLHDVGHGPLSHTTEFAMPELKLLFPSHPQIKIQPRQANHEDYTLKMILASGLTPHLERAGKSMGFSPLHVGALIDPKLEVKDDFFHEKINGEEFDFRPLLHQLISSEIDADRMDYLRRDSTHAGVNYGQFDYDWLVGNLTYHLHKGQCHLALQHRALYAFEDFLISRYHMFLMIYFHYKSVVYDTLLAKYFESPDCDYQLPWDIEKYCDCNDAHLYSHLVLSKNSWARRIVEKRPYKMLVELHTGIPAGKTAAAAQGKLLEEIQKNLEKNSFDYLPVTSTSELSKYFGKPGDPIYVRYDNHYSAPSFIPLERCTDLFQRYAEKRSITRLYVSPENYPHCQTQGRNTPLPYEEDFTAST